MAIGDTLVKIAGKNVKLSDLARGGEVLTFDGYLMTYKRANKSVGQMTVYDENKPESRSLTQQSFKAESDINTIMDKYIKTGLPPIPVGGEPLFGDFSSGQDFSDQQRNVAEFSSLFELLPPATRSAFDNDPARAINFALDPVNEDQAIALGLLPQKQAVTPASTPAVPATPGVAGLAPAPVTPVPVVP